MYLGAVTDNKCDENKDIDYRISKSNQCAGRGGVHKLLKEKINDIVRIIRINWLMEEGRIVKK